MFVNDVPYAVHCSGAFDRLSAVRRLGQLLWVLVAGLQKHSDRWWSTLLLQFVVDSMNAGRPRSHALPVLCISSFWYIHVWRYQHAVTPLGVRWNIAVRKCQRCKANRPRTARQCIFAIDRRTLTKRTKKSLKGRASRQTPKSNVESSSTNQNAYVYRTDDRSRIIRPSSPKLSVA